MDFEARDFGDLLHRLAGARRTGACWDPPFPARGGNLMQTQQGKGNLHPPIGYGG